MTTKTGGCLCGAVRFEAEGVEEGFGICHCGMCRRWTGGVYAATQTKVVRFTAGEDQVKTYTSSDWAERGFCGECGSNLFYRITLEGPMKGATHLALGSLDELEGMTLETELYVDLQPACLRDGEAKNRLTEAQVMAMFAPPE